MRHSKKTFNKGTWCIIQLFKFWVVGISEHFSYGAGNSSRFCTATYTCSLHPIAIVAWLEYCQYGVKHKLLCKPNEIPVHYYNAKFLFYIYECILYGTLTLDWMLSTMIIIKIIVMNFGLKNKAFYCYIRSILDTTSPCYLIHTI